MPQQPAPDRYAVAGHPIAHSRSPFIHALFAEQTGQHLVYGALDIAPEDFTREVNRFRSDGGRGLNVTVPLKEHAFAYAGQHGERALRAGAVNTLRFDADGSVFADNTDGPGLVRDLEVNHGCAIAGLKLLMLGAGGAARGVLGPLLDRSPRSVLLANRTRSRAEALADAFAGEGDVSCCALDAIPAGGFDLVINATATGLTGAHLPLSAGHLADGALCYDMMYGPRPTAFLQQVRSLGAARCADGRGMLVEQAAESFFIWRGVRPQTAPVIARLSEALAADAG